MALLLEKGANDTLKMTFNNAALQAPVLASLPLSYNTFEINAKIFC